MTNKPIVSVPNQLAGLLSHVPPLFAASGKHGSWKYIEFFTANIRNPHTRRAYARAARRLSDWCERRHVQLAQLNPVVISAYIEELMNTHAKPSVKQELAAIRMLFDWLVVGQVVPFNPASSVRGPKHVVKRGSTPVLTPDEARLLIGSIETDTIGGLRDRAMIAVMVYSFARVGALVGMNVEDYLQQGKRWWFRLHEKNGKRHDVPAHHTAEEFLDAYIEATGLATAENGSPLFRTLDRHKQLTGRRIGTREVLSMVKRRARQADLGDHLCCHSFRATGITAYLLNGGSIERAAAIAAHESTRTTQLYNRTDDAISLDEIEKIVI